MKKLNNLKHFALGFAACLLVSMAIVPAVAATVHKTATLEYSNIKITLDGKPITPTDANGKAVEPFTVDGATYLPVRGIANALGLGVGWDAATQTVTLTSRGTSQPSGSVLMDKNGVKITFGGIVARQSVMGGYDIKLKIENNSSNNYTVQIRDLSINGIMSSHKVFSSDVVAGKVANSAIWVYDLEADGISAPIATAELYFHVFESDSWSNSFDSDVVTIK